MLPQTGLDARWLLKFGTLLLAFANCSLQGAACYNDDGTIIEGDAPCHPDADQSFCCGKYWTCLDSGVCSDQNTTQLIHSDQTLLARATCTDRTYGSSVCPQFCLGDLGRGITLSDTNNSFCCQQDLDQPCSADPTIRNLELGTPITTISLAAASSSAVKAKTSTTAESTSKLFKTSKVSASHPHPTANASKGAKTSSADADMAAGAASTSRKAPLPVATKVSQSSSSGLSEGAKIGIAVGVTLVAVSVAASLLFVWYKRRERRKMDGRVKPDIPASTAQAPGAHDQGYYAPVNSGMNQALQEMEESHNPYSTALRGELATDSLNPRAELSDPPGQKLAAEQRRPSELQ